MKDKTEQKKKKTKKETVTETVEMTDEKLLEVQDVETELIQKIQKRFHVGALRKAGDVPDVFRLRRPTGIPSLDVRLHGGLPAGGITQIIGEDGVGKTDLCWRIMRQAQLNYGDYYRGAMFCVEMQPDLSQARWAGLKVPFTESEIGWYEEEVGERISEEERVDLMTAPGETYFPVAGSAEDTLDTAIELLASGIFQVIVVDSISALQASKMSTRDLKDGSIVASQANVLTNFMQKVWSTYNTPLPDGRANETTIIVLNQFREKVDETNKYLAKDPRAMGGRALKHGKLVDLHMRTGAKKKSDVKINGHYVRLGKEIHTTITKGKAGMHEGAVASWTYSFDVGVDTQLNLLDLGVECGVVQKGGGGNYSVDGESLGRGANKAVLEIERFRDSIIREAEKKEGVRPYRVC
jgi:RecA/RadA recombinase